MLNLPSLPSLPRIGMAAAPKTAAGIDPALLEAYLKQSQEKGMLGHLWSGVSNIFDVLNRPAYAVGNLLAGDPAAAGRAMIPFGQTIENLTGLNTGLGQDERRLASETIGLGKEHPWYIRTPVNLGIDIATDPTTYLTSGMTAYGRAAGSVGKGVSKIDDVAKLLANVQKTGNLRQIGKMTKAEIGRAHV